MTGVQACALPILAANFTGSAPVGAAYCRNVPRADAPALTRLLCATDPGYARDGKLTLLPDKETYAALDPDSRRLLYNFNDVASALPRELWELHPFPRTVFGEDVLQARAILEAGYAIAYDAVATVEHSHDYNTREIFERACIDGRFNAQWLDRICLASEQDVDVLCERLRPGDEADIEELGLEPAARADRDAAIDKLIAQEPYFTPITIPAGTYKTPATTVKSFGARLAALLGLPYAFASHFAPAAMMQALELYRAEFQPSEQLDASYAMVGFNVFAAESDDEADFLRSSSQQSFLSLRRGQAGPLPPPVAGFEETLSAPDKRVLDDILSCSVAGAAKTVQAGIADFIDGENEIGRASCRERA